MPLKLSLVSNAPLCKTQKLHKSAIKIAHITQQHACNSMKEKDVYIGQSPGKHMLEVGQLHVSSTSAVLLMLLLAGMRFCSIPARKSWHVWSLLALL